MLLLLAAATLPEEAESALDLATRISQASGGVLLVLVLAALLRGWLILRQHHLDVLAAKDQELEEVKADRDWWKDGLTATLKIGQVWADGPRRDA